jgi:hypothetical protein
VVNNSDTEFRGVNEVNFMATIELGDTILEREFEATDADGNQSIIKLRLGIPYLKSDSTSSLKWRCPYQITGKGFEKVKLALGMDAIDAMLMSIQLADVWMKSYQRDMKITWMGEEWLGLIFPPLKERTDQDKIPMLDNAASTQAFNEVFPSEDENSPFKKVFDEFFRNFNGNRSSPQTPDQAK